MLHILWIILKVIGIILLSVVGILLLLLLFILFSPIMYRAEGKADREEQELRGRVSWLLGMIRCRVSYEEQKLLWNVRLFGITMAGNEQWFVEKQEKKKKKKEDREKKKESARKTEKEETEKQTGVMEIPEKGEILPEKKVPETGITIPEEKVPETGITIPEEKTPESEEIIPAEDLQDSLKTVPAAEETSRDLTEHTADGKVTEKAEDPLRVRLVKKKNKAIEKIKKFRQKCREFPEKLRKKRERIREKWDTCMEWKEFWYSDETQLSKKLAIGYGKKLLHHISPYKGQAVIRFGLEDPYVMGQILAAAGMFMPVYEDKLKLIPDFSEEILEGEGFFRGRIVPGYLVYLALSVWMDKNLKRTIKEGKKLMGGKENGSKK